MPRGVRAALPERLELREMTGGVEVARAGGLHGDGGAARRPSGDGTWRISEESEMRRTSNGRSATSSDATDDTDLV